MKSEKAITPMRCVNANPGKYVSIITNFGCHYTCPECIVRNNGLKMSETDNFSTQEPLNKVLCKERPEWVSVSGGGDPLFHWKEHWSFYEGLFHTAERRNVKLEMHTSYLPDSPEVQDFPLNWFERVVYHVHKFDDLLHVKRKFGEIVRVVFVVDDNMTEQDLPCFRRNGQSFPFWDRAEYLRRRESGGPVRRHRQRVQGWAAVGASSRILCFADCKPFPTRDCPGWGKSPGYRSGSSWFVLLFVLDSPQRGVGSGRFTVRPVKVSVSLLG